MDISSFELADFLQSLQKKGMVEIRMSAESIWAEPETCTFEAVGEHTVKIAGRTGYGLLTQAHSTVLVDINEIEYIRHAPKS